MAGSYQAYLEGCQEWSSPITYSAVSAFAIHASGSTQLNFNASQPPPPPLISPMTPLPYQEFGNVTNTIITTTTTSDAATTGSTTPPPSAPSGTPAPACTSTLLAAQAAEAAGLQGDFWGMHDLLFTRQSEWSNLGVASFQDWLIAAASELGLDAGQFAADLLSETVVNKLQLARQTALDLGLPGTPTLVINGQYYDGPWDLVNLSAIIKLIRLEGQQYTDCPPFLIDPLKQYRATLRTDKGEIVVELFAEQAPIAVNNFVFLAREGWYDGVTFHRVLPGFVAQAGDPTGTGFGGPGLRFCQRGRARADFRRRRPTRHGKCRPRLQRQPVLHHLRRPVAAQRRLHHLRARALWHGRGAKPGGA
jgi:hypothetical protein